MCGDFAFLCGVVETVETERSRHYYNVRYDDGDGEEFDEAQYVYGHESRQEHTVQESTRQYNTRQDKTIQYKTRQDNTRQDKTRQD
jgi:hypothetical protein